MSEWKEAYESFWSALDDDKSSVEDAFRAGWVAACEKWQKELENWINDYASELWTDEGTRRDYE